MPTRLEKGVCYNCESQNILGNGFKEKAGLGWEKPSKKAGLLQLSKLRCCWKYDEKGLSKTVQEDVKSF